MKIRMYWAIVGHFDGAEAFAHFPKSAVTRAQAERDARNSARFMAKDIARFNGDRVKTWYHDISIASHAPLCIGGAEHRLHQSP